MARSEDLAAMSKTATEFCRRFARKRSAVGGAVLFALIVAAAAAAPILFPEDPWNMVAPPLLWPGQDMDFPLGSDPLGRDIAAGIFHGARMALLIGAVSTLAALAIGITIGAVS